VAVCDLCVSVCWVQEKKKVTAAYKQWQDSRDFIEALITLCGADVNSTVQYRHLPPNTPQPEKEEERYVPNCECSIASLSLLSLCLACFCGSLLLLSLASLSLTSLSLLSVLYVSVGLLLSL
jgi:hypothetical protein